MWSDLTLGPSFEVKRWFTGFGEFSSRWIHICIGSLLHRSSYFCYYKQILMYFMYFYVCKMFRILKLNNIFLCMFPGEVSSGKSTLLNLFLGKIPGPKKLELPTSTLSCTGRVCECFYIQYYLTSPIKVC